MASEAPDMNIALLKQLEWAARTGLDVDSKGYVDNLDKNLIRPLGPQARSAYARGSGDELTSKMLALHSSSALVVNVFEHWSLTDPEPLAEALQLRAPIVTIDFEAQHPAGLPGTPPHLDVCITLQGGFVVAIESKFGEWLMRKTVRAAAFKAKYFSKRNGGGWASAGLPRCQRLAEAMRDGQTAFEYLDAPQLLKHALGMATSKGSRFSLSYLYYDWDVPQAQQHREELDEFADLVDPGLGFHALTYQDLFSRLEAVCGDRQDPYIQYLQARYFRE
jgi:hypothetical protein